MSVTMAANGNYSSECCTEDETILQNTDLFSEQFTQIRSIT